MARFGTSRWLGAVAVGLCSTALIAQPPQKDPLAEARVRQKIADQKAEAEVLAAIQDADRTAKTNPAKAAQAIRAAQTNIDLAAAISGETRKTLTAQLQSKLAAVEGRPAPAGGAKLDANSDAAKAAQKAAFDKYVEEVKAVREGVDRVVRYQNAGDTKAATDAIAKLAAAYPNNPAVIALTTKDTFADRAAESRMFAQLQSDRIVAANNDLMRSSLPAKGDVEFPADWKEKTKRRSLDAQLTAKEKKIIEALNKPITTNFVNRPLEEALQDLSNQMDQPLVVDTKSLKDLNIDLKNTATLQATGISGRNVLRQLLASQGLTFVVKDEVIQVVTVERARDLLTTRVYYLGDVIQGVGPFAGALTWGPFVDFQQTVANAEAIIQAITTSIDPLCWKPNGPCTIVFHAPSMSIIVRASAEVHATLGGKFGGGR